MTDETYKLGRFMTKAEQQKVKKKAKYKTEAETGPAEENPTKKK